MKWFGGYQKKPDTMGAGLYLNLVVGSCFV